MRARIGNADQAHAAGMYLALLQEAIDRQSQRVVTPESGTEADRHRERLSQKNSLRSVNHCCAA